MQFKALEKGIEVNGQTVYSIVDGYKHYISLATKYLLEVGIGEKGTDDKIKIDTNQWYSQENWLKAFENIAKNIGGGNMVLKNIGLSIPQNAKFPPWVKDIESAIKSIDIAYHMNHKKNGKEMFNSLSGEKTEGIGHYGYEKIEGKNIIMSECNNPYPCDFDIGIITAMARKFQVISDIREDKSKPCRKNGADSCTYIITW